MLTLRKETKHCIYPSYKVTVINIELSQSKCRFILKRLLPALAQYIQHAMGHNRVVQQRHKNKCKLKSNINPLPNRKINRKDFRGRIHHSWSFQSCVQLISYCWDRIHCFQFVLQLPAWFTEGKKCPTADQQVK